MIERYRRIPLLFRWAGLLLLVSSIAGQVWQRQPGGAATSMVLANVARHCPAAAIVGTAPTIADGARALDRAVFSLIADRYAPRPMPRCGAARVGPLGRWHQQPKSRARHGNCARRTRGDREALKGDLKAVAKI